MRVKINGKPEEVQEATVLGLLKSRNVDLRMVAVEVNSELVERDQYETTALKEGDEVEFLYFMGGGVK
jgi:sulfur carrier protein